MSWPDGYYMSTNGEPPPYLLHRMKDPEYQREARRATADYARQITLEERRVYADAVKFIKKAVVALRRGKALGINVKTSGIVEAYELYVKQKRSSMYPSFDTLLKSVTGSGQLVLASHKRYGDMLYLPKELPGWLKHKLAKAKRSKADRLVDKVRHPRQRRWLDEWGRLKDDRPPRWLID